MSSMKEIRDRIKSVKNTGQITRAMRMVAASNLRRVQAVMEPSKNFAKKNGRIVNGLLSESEEIDNTYLKPGKGDVVRYVMIVGNRGLCGIYNIALVQFAKEIFDNDKRKKELWVIGKWGKDVIKTTGFTDEIEGYELSDIPQMKEVSSICEKFKDDFKEGKVCEVNLLYQSYVSALKQDPVCEKFLPIERQSAEADDEDDSFKDYDFEPDREALIDLVVEQYLDNKMLSVFQEAKCGEHMARMTAMTNANENIDELVSKLQISYNRARQEAITDEISEIVGGASALKR